MGETRIGAGAKIDNLVQEPATALRLAQDTLLCAQVGVAGSAVVGKQCHPRRPGRRRRPPHNRRQGLSSPRSPGSPGEMSLPELPSAALPPSTTLNGCAPPHLYQRLPELMRSLKHRCEKRSSAQNPIHQRPSQSRSSLHITKPQAPRASRASYMSVQTEPPASPGLELVRSPSVTRPLAR